MNLNTINELITISVIH